MSKDSESKKVLLVRSWRWLSSQESRTAGYEIVFMALLDNKINDDFKLSITKLLNDGARYFVFFGKFSEKAHDCADEVILASSGHNEIVTTFFFPEDLDEAVEHFVSIASIGKESREFLAIVDSSGADGMIVANMLQTTFDASR